ncbi:MAG: hypothetical protein IJ289_09275 [Clostridia bacterium]|nr:hypothetical protein [Clostridia bacterium]
MKTIRKPDMLQSITIVFCICLAVMPFFVSGGYKITHTLKDMFAVFPTNLLIYITPALLYFSVRKNGCDEKEKSAFLLICDTLVTVLMYSALSMNGYTMTFSLAALLILSFLCINADDMISMAVLLPGILLFKLGTEFIFACYIPILLLLLLKTAESRKDKDKNKTGASFLPFAYLYISVLAVILLISGKISLKTDMPLQSFSDRSAIINLVSGIILILIACILFIIRAIPTTKGNIPQTITVTAFALYPVAVVFANCFFPLISSAPRVAVIFSLITYAVGNAQLSLTFREKAPPLLPEKLPFLPFAATVSVLFCFFIAE